MRRQTGRNWKLFMAVPILVAGGLILWVASGCMPSVAAMTETCTTPESNGEKPMTVKTEPNASEPTTLLSHRIDLDRPAERSQTGKVQHADSSTFAELVLDADVPVLVDFYADWCRPCQALGPVLDDFARETPDARVVKVNVDESPELASRYDVSGIPNLKLFKNGRVAGQHLGMASKANLRALLAR